MKNLRKICICVVLIINFAVFYCLGTACASKLAQTLDSAAKKVVSRAYKYISSIETTIFGRA